MNQSVPAFRGGLVVVQYVYHVIDVPHASTNRSHSNAQSKCSLPVAVIIGFAL
jgi:hypothetical protein